MTKPTLLLEAHLKALRLPTFLREYDKVAPVGGEFVGIRHRSIFGSREPGVPREVVAMA